jgi:hypothetical protein
MSEFIEECRREWKRLGVPDPIANEMAIDLTADIEEAEAEGGSAEDVLGNSLFDPRRFAAAWASARGVTAPPASVDPFTTLVRDRHPWYRPAMIIVIAVFGFLTVLAGVALVTGGRGSAMASSFHRIVVLPGAARLPGPSALMPPFRTFVSGPTFFVHNTAGFLVLAFVVLLGATVVLGLAILIRSLWFDRESKRRLW